MDRTIDIRNPIELHRAGYDVLVENLGAVGAVRFMGLFDKGSGDYTKEKYERDEPTIADVVAGIYKAREQK